jgi:transposase
VLWLKLAEQSKQLELQARQFKALEERLNTNSRHSSKPPSADPELRKTKASSGKKAGGQPGHWGSGRKLFSEAQVDQTHVVYPDRQCECGGKVKATHLHQRHQTIDIPPVKPQITEYPLLWGYARLAASPMRRCCLPGCLVTW